MRKGRIEQIPAAATYLVDHLPLCEQHEDVEELEDGVARLVDG